MAPMKSCIACGMPMTEPADFPGGDTGKDYCIHCARPNGSMQSFEEKRAGMADFIVRTQGYDQTAAVQIAERNMKRLPAWASFFKGDE